MRLTDLMESFDIFVDTVRRLTCRENENLKGTILIRQHGLGKL